MGKEQDYEAQNDARTLHEAHSVRKDKLRHEKAMKHLKKMSKGSTHAADTHAHEMKAGPMLHDQSGHEGDATGSLGNAEGMEGAKQDE